MFIIYVELVKTSTYMLTYYYYGYIYVILPIYTYVYMCRCLVGGHSSLSVRVRVYCPSVDTIGVMLFHGQWTLTPDADKQKYTRYRRARQR